MTTGSRIKELRIERGLRQTDLADRIGCTAQVISNIERGVTSSSAELVAAIARVLNVPVNSLIPDDVPSPLVLTEEENQLIFVYRKLLPNEQKMLLSFVEFMEQRHH